MTQAKIKRSNGSTLAVSECSHNVNCNPQTSAASSGGIQLGRIVRKEFSFCSSARSSRVRSYGRIETDRASKPIAAAEHTAEKILSAGICQVAGRNRAG